MAGGNTYETKVDSVLEWRQRDEAAGDEHPPVGRNSILLVGRHGGREMMRCSGKEFSSPVRMTLYQVHLVPAIDVSAFSLDGRPWL